MAQKKIKRKTTKKIHRKRRRNFLRRRWFVLILLVLSLLVTGLYLKQTLTYYYARYFTKYEHKKLTNTGQEARRIDRIVGLYSGKTFGIDISHYQRKKDIQWDSLSIANRSIPIQFVVLRATMGNRSLDRHFEEYWTIAKKHRLIRGAYHFYRADEDPVLQANNFLSTVKLEAGDLRPVLDIEKIPRRKSTAQLLKDLKIWCRIVEERYGEKPIIYTYYHYYKDFLRGEFDGYPIWLANYNDVPAPSPQDPWHLWQFTENGIVHGINTKVDLNVFHGNLWSLRQLTLD